MEVQPAVRVRSKGETSGWYILTMVVNMLVLLVADGIRDWHRDLKSMAEAQ